jgi:adenine/guanine phosphoribosyltransferase-like PRPP-binding protein
VIGLRHRPMGAGGGLGPDRPGRRRRARLPYRGDPKASSVKGAACSHVATCRGRVAQPTSSYGLFIRLARASTVPGPAAGGVPVGFQVARSLGAPLEVLSVRKLGVPGREELAMGAITSDGTRVVNRRVVGELGIAEDTLQAVAAAEQQELERRERTYRGQRPRPELTGKVVIVVDDGLATGGGSRPAAGPGRGRGAGRGRLGLPEAATGCRRGHLRQHAGAVCGRWAGLPRLWADDRRGGLCPARCGPANQRRPRRRWLTGSSCLGQPPAALPAGLRDGRQTPI